MASGAPATARLGMVRPLIQVLALLVLLEAGVAFGWYAFLPSAWYLGSAAVLLLLALGCAPLAALCIASGRALLGRLPGLAGCRDERLLGALALLAPLVFVIKASLATPSGRLYLLPAALLLLPLPALGLVRLLDAVRLQRPPGLAPSAFFVIACGVILNKLDPAGFWERSSLRADLATALAGALLFLLLRRGPEAGALVPRRAFLAVPLLAFLAAYLANQAPRLLRGAGPRGAQRSGSDAGDASRPNLLLIIVDTLRGDGPDEPGARVAAGAGGFSRLEREGVRFLDATSPSSWTMPSVAAVLSGSQPRRIGAHLHGISRAPTTLPRILRGAGYRTGAFIDNAILTGEGFEAGYERFECPINLRLLRVHSLQKLLPLAVTVRTLRAFHEVDRGAEETVSRLLRWTSREDGRPFFAYLHLMDPHYPYYGEEGVGEILASGVSLQSDRYFWSFAGPNRRFTREQFARLRERYPVEVRRVDSAVGRLAGELAARGLWERTLVALVGDHGEEFGEHLQFGHGHTVYQELVHVPMFVKWPAASGVPPGRSESPVSTIDVFPTLLQAAGLEAPAKASDGSPLLPLARGESDETRRILSETSDRPVPSGVRLWKYREGTRAVIVAQKLASGPSNVSSLSVVEVDGDETPASDARDPADAPLVQRALTYYASLWGRAAAGPREMTEDVKEKLRALGYVH